MDIQVSFFKGPIGIELSGFHEVFRGLWLRPLKLAGN